MPLWMVGIPLLGYTLPYVGRCERIGQAYYMLVCGRIVHPFLKGVDTDVAIGSPVGFTLRVLQL